jgi:hypothetical protein
MRLCASAAWGPGAFVCVPVLHGAPALGCCCGAESARPRASARGGCLFASARARPPPSHAPSYITITRSLYPAPCPYTSTRLVWMSNAAISFLYFLRLDGGGGSEGGRGRVPLPYPYEPSRRGVDSSFHPPANRPTAPPMQAYTKLPRTPSPPPPQHTHHHHTHPTRSPALTLRGC